MSTAIVTPRITVEDFLQRPARDDGWHEELIDGEVILSPNAKKLHSHVSAKINRLLLPLEQQGFIVLGEVACRLGPDALPNTDAAVVDLKLWQAIPDNEFLSEAPALAIEIHSPGNTRQALLRKVALYLEHGAEQCWIIYPHGRKLVAYFPDGTSEQTGEEGTVSFHDCIVPVRDLFL